MSKTIQLSLITGLLLLLFVVAMMGGLIESERWKINQLQVSADFHRITAEQLRRVVAKTPERSFFRLEASEIKANIEEMPWVETAHVVKKWPDTLIITVKEHQAVAVWNDKALLSSAGDIFVVDGAELGSELPQLYGQDERASDIWFDFVSYNQLLKPVGYEIAQAKVNERDDWRLILRNGLELVLGTEQHAARIVRLAETWDALLVESDKLPEIVDLRYSNGYVVRWRQQGEVMERTIVEGELGNHG